MIHRVFIVSVLCLSGLLAGCQAVPKAAHVPPSHITINQGYALLYDTISQVSQVDKILYLKKPGETVSDLLTEIANLTKQAKTQLDTFAS